MARGCHTRDMGKLLLVAAPLALYAIAYGVRARLGRRPSRHALNVEIALLLVAYFLATAGLGIFWVANQQLPPFDLHYLFGYATFVLVTLHLAMNAKIIVSYFRKGPRPAKHPLGNPVLVKSAAALALAAGAFFLGLRAGSPRLPTSFSGAGDPSLAALEQYHGMSSHTRSGVILKAPSVVWDLPVEKYVDRGERPRIALEPPDPNRAVARDVDEALAGELRAPHDPFDRRDLSVVLWATAGITDRRGGHDLRASASSGALFPTEVYVIAFDVEGLASGVYAYAPEDHSLVDLGRTPSADPRMGLRDQYGRPPEVAIVVTSVFRRTGQKYRDRAYRYAIADAGHAVGNTIVAAAEVAMATEVVPHFDDGYVAETIGVDNVTEGVVALLSLRRDAPPSVASTAGAFVARPIPNVDELELGATGLAHVATSLSWIAADVDGDRVELPEAPRASARPLQLIAERRSQRKFRPDPLALVDLSGTLRAAAAAPPVVSRAVRVHVVASRVEGVVPGAFRYDPELGALVRRTSGDVDVRAGRAALDQNVVGHAPVAIVLTIDRRALASEGARGYRNAFLEAGILGARLYLATAAHELRGCSVGAFYDQETAELLGIDLAKEWPIHFFAMGVAE